MEKKVLERLQRQCARAEYCASEVFRKALRALEGDAEAAGRIVESLRKDRFVDDRRYASAFAREKASLQGWGPVIIRFQLQGKGISRDDIDAALEDLDAVRSADRLRRLAAEKARTLQGDPAARLKLIRYLLSRGYDYAAVAPLADELV